MTNRKSLERLIDISEKVEEKHPSFVAFTKRVVGKKRIGLQLYDGQKLTEEYTLLMNGYCFEGYEKGITNPFVTWRWQETSLEQYVAQEEFIIAHPVLARLRYIPFEVIKGNIKLGRR